MILYVLLDSIRNLAHYSYTSEVVTIDHYHWLQHEDGNAILFEMDCSANAEYEGRTQSHKKTASKHYLKPQQTRMKHQMTLNEANDQERRAEMLPVRISQ